MLPHVLAKVIQSINLYGNLDSILAALVVIISVQQASLDIKMNKPPEQLPRISC